MKEPDHRLGERVVVRVARASHEGLDPGPGQVLGAAKRAILGGLNRSSQDLSRDAFDGHEKVEAESRWPWRLALTGQTHCGTPR